MSRPTAWINTPAGRGDCPSGKVQFATRKEARAARRFRQIKAGVFRCPDCDWFHIGHTPPRVRNGEIDKAQWLRAKGIR